MARRGDRGLALGWLVAMAVVLEVIAIVLFVPSARVAAYNAAERVSVAGELGTQTEDYVIASANRWYRASLIETGMVRALDEYLFHGSRRPRAAESHYALTRYARDRVQAFWDVLYALYYRVALIWLWTPCLLPALIPVLLDAREERHVRQWRFSFVSPMVRALAARAGLVMGMTLVIALMAPLHVPPLAYPALFGVLMLANWVWVANLQKRM